MKSRLVSIFLVLCLLTPCLAVHAENVASADPAAMQGDALITPNPDNAALWPIQPEYALHSDYELRVQLLADAFPHNPDIHYAAWGKLLDKLSLSGSLKSWHIPYPDQVYFHEGSLNLNGNPTIRLDGHYYDSKLFLKSNAWNNDYVAFKMLNFFEFMKKPSYFGVNLKPVSILLYPEASLYLADTYHNALAPYFAGEGSRHISYEQLSALCEDLNGIVNDEEDRNQPLHFLYNLLSDLSLAYTVYEQLGEMEVYLDYLDPEKQGMTIIAQDGSECWQIGGRTLLRRSLDAASPAFTLTLQNQEGCELTVDFLSAPEGTLSARLSTTNAEKETTIDLRLALTLPAENALHTDGTAQFILGGSYLAQQPRQWDFRYTLERTAAQLPSRYELTVEWLHPETLQPALRILLNADQQSIARDSLPQPKYHNVPDFFSLNEGLISQYVETYSKSFIAALFPFAMELPGGAINDLMNLVQEYHILEMLGIY